MEEKEEEKTLSLSFSLSPPPHRPSLAHPGANVNEKCVGRGGTGWGGLLMCGQGQKAEVSGAYCVAPVTHILTSSPTPSPTPPLLTAPQNQ